MVGIEERLPDRQQVFDLLEQWRNLHTRLG